MLLIFTRCENHFSNEDLGATPFPIKVKQFSENEVTKQNKTKKQTKKEKRKKAISLAIHVANSPG